MLHSHDCTHEAYGGFDHLQIIDATPPPLSEAAFQDLSIKLSLYVVFIFSKIYFR